MRKEKKIANLDNLGQYNNFCFYAVGYYIAKKYYTVNNTDESHKHDTEKNKLWQKTLADDSNKQAQQI